MTLFITFRFTQIKSNVKVELQLQIFVFAYSRIFYGRWILFLYTHTHTHYTFCLQKTVNKNFKTIFIQNLNFARHSSQDFYFVVVVVNNAISTQFYHITSNSTVET